MSSLRHCVLAGDRRGREEELREWSRVCSDTESFCCSSAASEVLVAGV